MTSFTTRLHTLVFATIENVTFLARTSLGIYPMSESSDATGDAIASCVIQVFNALPLKFKPSSRTAHAKEWVPLSGIVIVDDNVRCVSLG